MSQVRILPGVLFYCCEIGATRGLAQRTISRCGGCHRLSAVFATLCDQGRAVRALSIFCRAAPRARVASVYPKNRVRTPSRSRIRNRYKLATWLGSASHRRDSEPDHRQSRLVLCQRRNPREYLWSAGGQTIKPGRATAGILRFGIEKIRRRAATW